MAHDEGFKDFDETGASDIQGEFSIPVEDTSDIEDRIIVLDLKKEPTKPQHVSTAAPLG